jgi:tol-pal system protein YbgF
VESARLAVFCVFLAAAAATSGCVSQGDFLRMQERVAEVHERDGNQPDPFARIAQLSSDVETLRRDVRNLQGELELARKESADALLEVRRTRSALAEGASAGNGQDARGGAQKGDTGEASAPVVGSESDPARDQELAGYQTALEAWRQDDFAGCLDRFTSFLQAYPKSGYADDAAYWLADCTYKNDEFKRAVVRFNAVVSVYPDSPKAPDALYRQGESLLKLGPTYHEAARTVFKNVQKEYPDSKRAAEAAQQLERLGAG